MSATAEPSSRGKALELLKARYPWPPARPFEMPVAWELDSGGRELITELIRQRSPCLFVEVGVFLGGSSRRWLETSPDCLVIAIDPWEGDWWVDYARKHRHRELERQFASDDGPRRSSLTALWDHRDRIIPMQGYSPEKLVELKQLGLEPDIVYFDSEKQGRGIMEALDLFPGCVVAGDDWTWGQRDGYPIRAPVRAAAAAHGLNVRVRRGTWILARQRLSLGARRDALLSQAKDLARTLNHRVSGLLTSRA